MYRGFVYEATEIGGKPTTNSEGQPIHSTPEGIAAFWVWFGNSVTVDDQGRPVVYFHGNIGDFDEFQLPFERDGYDENENYSEGWDGGNLGHGHYFTEHYLYAKRFGNPKKYYLKVLKMYDLSTDEAIEAFNSEFREVRDELNYGEPGELIEENMRLGGYDGVIGKDVGGFANGASEVMVPKSNQIKAVDNAGTFNSTGNFKLESEAAVNEGFLSAIADVGMKAMGAGEIPGQTVEVVLHPNKKNKETNAERK